MTTKAKTLIILLATLIIGVAVGALASGLLRDRREHRIHNMPPQNRFLRAMRDIIRPSDEQADRINELIEKKSLQLSEINERHQNEVWAIMDSMQTELETLLTDEQRARLASRLARGMERGFERRIAYLTRELQLTLEQVSRIEGIMARMEEDRPPPKSFRGRPPDEVREQMRNRFMEMHKQIEDVLDPEQREKYRKLQPDGPPFGRGFRPDRKYRGPRGEKGKPF